MGLQCVTSFWAATPVVLVCRYAVCDLECLRALNIGAVSIFEVYIVDFWWNGVNDVLP